MSINQSFLLSEGMGALRSRLVRQVNATRIVVAERIGNSEENKLSLPLTTLQVVDELHEFLPFEHRLPESFFEDNDDDDDDDPYAEDDEFPEEDDTDEQEAEDEEDAPDPRLMQPHKVPWPELIRCVCEYIRSQMNIETGGHPERTTFRAKVYRGSKRLWTTTIAVVRPAEGTVLASDLPHPASTRMGTMAVPPAEPAGFDGPLQPDLNDAFGRLLHAHEAAGASLLQRIFWGISQLQDQQRQLTDQAMNATHSSRAEAEALRKMTMEMFMASLNLRKEQVDAKEREVEARLEDRRVVAHETRVTETIDKGMGLLENVGRVYLAREHPQLLGLTPEAMNLASMVAANPKLSAATQDPRFALLLQSPEFSEALTTMMSLVQQAPDTTTVPPPEST